MGRMMDFYNMESSFSIVDISLKLPQMAQKSILFQTRHFTLRVWSSHCLAGTANSQGK